MALSLVICHLSFSPAGAQTFTQRLQKSVKGEGTVTLHQDRAIDELVNGGQAAAPAPKETEKKEQPKADGKEKETKKTEPTPATPTTSATVDTPAASVDSTYLHKTGKTYKMTGYRVQAFAGGNSRKDKRKAEQTGNQLRMLFPTETVYTHFYSPRWICRMGNYRTYEEAHQMLLEVRKLGFGSATIVKGKITVQY